MKTITRTEDDLILNVWIAGKYENCRVEEVELKGPDNESWLFTEQEAALLGLIDDDIVEALAYEVAYELDMEYNIDRADYLYDQMKDG
jgi:hypothetical protein